MLTPTEGGSGRGAIPPPGPPGEAGAGPLDRAVAWICYAAASVAALAVLVSLAATGYSVFMRYVLGQPVVWIDELSGYLVVAIVMFGAAEALRRGDHIRVDLLTANLTGIPLRAMRAFWMICVLLVMGALLKSSVTAVTFARDFGIYSEGYLATPIWVPQSMLVIGAVLVMLAALARLIAALRGGDGGGDDGTGDGRA